MLAVFHLDNQHVFERVAANYGRIYGGRTPRPGFKKTEFKRRVAAAFAICNTLTRQQMPRPPSYVANLCEVPCRALLNLPSALNLGPAELERLGEEDYELAEARPQEYIDAVCSQLGIPFSLAGEARQLAEEAEWALHGRQPTVIAAACLQQSLADRGRLGVRIRREDICDIFTCQQRSVNQALAALRRRGGRR